MIQKQIKNASKSFGSMANRANDENLSIHHPHKYKQMLNAQVTGMQHSAKILHPANPKKFLEDSTNFFKPHQQSRQSNKGILPEESRETLRTLCNSAKKGSVERRAIAAMAHHAFPHDKIVTETKTRKKANEDIETILNKQLLQRTIYSRKKVSDQAIELAVKFILSNVQRLAWGTHTVKIGGNEHIELPRLIRCMNSEDMNRAYVSYCDKSSSTQLCRTEFLKLAKAISKGGDYRAISCVDYTVGVLINDNFERLQSVVDQLFHNYSEMHRYYSDQITYARDFLKTKFDSHVTLEDGDLFHSLTHALSKQQVSDTTKCDPGNKGACCVCNGSGKLECSGCKFVFWLCSMLLKEVRKCPSVQTDEDDSLLLPPMWSIKYSVTHQLSYYQHDDFGSTWLHPSKLIDLVEDVTNEFFSEISPNPDAVEIPSLSRPENCTQSLCENSSNHLITESFSSESIDEASFNESDSMNDPRHEGVTDNIDDDKWLQGILDQETTMNDTVVEDRSHRPMNEERRAEAIKVIKDSSGKAFIYMRHRARVWCQREFYNELEQELYDECFRTRRNGTRCIWVIDFKQKFESMSGRETQTEGFGKRGMTWHGISIIFWVWNEEFDEPERCIYYIDQILDKTNKQDTWATATLLEAAVAALKLDVPELNEGIVCCDNAANYSSKYLAFLLAIMNAKHDGFFYFSRLFHTETQDGKGITDSHFAIVARHLVRFIKNYVKNKIRKILTPRGLTFAIAWDGGVRNAVVQLVDVDCEHLEFLSDLLKKSNTELGKVFRQRASDIVFERPDPRAAHRVQSIDWSDRENIKKNLNGLSLILDAAAHSGYGRRVKFMVTLDENKPVVQIDTESQQMLHHILGGSNFDNSDEEETSINEDNNGMLFHGHEHEFEYSDDDSDFDDHSQHFSDHSVSNDSSGGSDDDISLESHIYELLEQQNDEDNGQCDEIRGYGKPDDSIYIGKNNFFTKAKVLMVNRMKRFVRKNKKKKKKKTKGVKSNQSHTKVE